MKNGVAHNEDLSMKSPLLRVSGAGDIDIGNDRLNYVLKPTLVATTQGQGGKDRSEVAGLTIPVKLTGPLESPQYTIDFAGMVQDVAKQRIRRSYTPAGQKAARHQPRDGDAGKAAPKIPSRTASKDSAVNQPSLSRARKRVG